MVENVVQAIARDCLAVTLERLEKQDFQTVIHVHDEAVIDYSHADQLQDVERIMGEPIPWAKDLPLTADGFSTNFYMKD